MSRLTDKDIALSASDLDWLHIVQISDTTSSPQGTSKRISKFNFLDGFTGFDSRYYTETEVDGLLTNRDNWDTAFGWGDHSLVGYLTTIPSTYLESGDNISELINDVGYLASFTETDPIFAASQAANITAQHITNLNNLSGVNTGDQDLSPYQLLSEKGQANGYVPLNASGQIPTQYLPDGIDDVLEFADLASFPTTGESGKIYLAIDTNFTYRWSGSTYVQVGGGQAPVDSVFGRTGIVTAQSGDYSAFYAPFTHTHTTSDIINLSSYTGFDSRYLRGDTSDNINGSFTAIGNISLSGNAIADETVVRDLNWLNTAKSGDQRDAILRVRTNTGVDGDQGAKFEFITRNNGGGFSFPLTIGGVNNAVEFKGLSLWRNASGLSYQRADARTEGDEVRLHWYGVNNSGGTEAFKHAWYDRSNSRYINVTAIDNAARFQQADRVRVEAYRDSLRVATLEGNASGGALILTDDALSSTVIRGYGNSDFYGGGLYAYNGELHTGSASTSFNGQLTIAKTDGGSVTLTYEDNYLRWRRGGTGTINGWSWDNFDTRVATLSTSGVLNVADNIISGGDIFANGTKYEGDGKEIIRFSDAWLRLNPLGEFTNGIYCGNTGVLRHDVKIEVGSGGASFYANNSGHVGLSGQIRRPTANSAYFVGSHNITNSSTHSNPIFTIGAAYLPALTTLGNMFGIGYANAAAASFLNSTDLGTNPSGWGLYVASDGNARIFLNSSSGHGYFGGNIYTDNVQLNSDERKKAEIQDIGNLEVPVRWRKFKLKKDLNKQRFGIIAQELQETNPEFVDSDNEGNLTVNYIDLLVAKNAELEARIAKLESLIEKLT